jgi:hypothetical protein
MSEKTTIKAPLPVTITIYLLASAGLFNIIYSFTGAYAPYGLFYPAVNVLVTVGLFASFAGLSNMEKWGLYLFFVMLAFKCCVSGAAANTNLRRSTTSAMSLACWFGRTFRLRVPPTRMTMLALFAMSAMKQAFRFDAFDIVSRLRCGVVAMKTSS